jgi:hypothetical protein
VEVLPDFRLRVTERLDAQYQLYKDAATFIAEVRLPWGTENEKFPGCRLIGQPSSGQIENAYDNPNDPPPVLLRVYEQIDESEETMVGEPSVTFDQDGNLNVEFNYIQFSTGTPVDLVVGTQAAPAPYATAILKEQIATDDGTLRTIKRIYNGDRTLSDVSELRFGGKVIVRTIVAIGTIPPTPAGFTLIGPGVLHPDGRQIFTYQFSAAAGSGGTPGTSGVISQGFTNNQGGDVAFNPASPTSATGEVICTTTAVSPQATTSNPITQPVGFVLWSVEVEDDAGFRRWVTKASFGGGLATSKDTDGARDGSITYTVTQNDDDGTLVPAYPGAGTAYNTKLTHARDNGFFRNTAIWVKPPATVTLKQTTQFEKPGSAVFTGSPPQLVITAPATLTILADMEVSYDVTQITDTPFTVSQPATFYEAYTPTDTGISVTSTQALGRYLAGASGISGTNSVYNGILCDTWSATLGSSTPSSFSLDLKVLKTDNEIYLTDVSGTVVYRRTKISYDFS